MGSWSNLIAICVMAIQHLIATGQRINRLRLRLRTRITENSGVSDLSILSIEKEIAWELQEDKIIDDFAASDKYRRIILL